MRRLRDAALVAAFDLGESLRARRVLVLLALYVAGAMAATGGFVAVLRELEGQLASALAVPTTSRPGAMANSLMESQELRRMLRELVGDAALVDQLVQVPLLALFYGWLAFTFVPALVTFTSCDAVAGEVASGSSRFALARTDRLAWALGKAGGQAALLGVGVLGGALGAWLVGFFGLSGFPAMDTAIWLVKIGFRGWVNGLPYLGIALAASLVLRSPTPARALALFLLLGVGVGDTLLSADRVVEAAPVLLPTLRQLLPGSHTLDLWRPTLLERAPALVMQPTLAAAFFALGFARFNRRDA